MIETLDSLRLLHLEDNLADAELARFQLEEAFSNCIIVHAHERSDFRNYLDKERFDVIISDYNVPGIRGLESLEMAKYFSPSTPFIYVSGAIGEEGAVEMLKHGATDYVLKNKLEKLPIAVERAMREVFDRENVALKEQQLKASNSFKTSIINAIKAQIIVVNAEGDIVDSNDSWKSFLELHKDYFQLDSLETLNYFDLLNKIIPVTQENQWLLDKIGEVISGKVNQFSHDFAFQGNGETEWFTLHTSIRLDDVGVVITQTNITDRVLSEIKLKKNEQEFRSLAENAPNHIVKVNREFNIEYINRDVFGKSRSQITGTSGFNLVDPKNATFIREQLQKVFDTGKAVFYKTKRTLSDGRLIFMGTNVGPVTNANGEVESVILIIRDMTDEVISQERIASQNQELIRLDDIHQIGLNQSKKVCDLITRCFQLIPEIVTEAKTLTYIYDPDIEDLAHQLSSLKTKKLTSKSDKYTVDITRLVPELKSGSPLIDIIQKKEIFISNEEKVNLKLLKNYQEVAMEAKAITPENMEEIKSVIILPLLLNDSVFGVFVITASEKIDKPIPDMLGRLMSGVKSVLLKKQAEQTIIANERRYRQLFESMHEGFVKISLDGKILIFNPKFCELLGYEPEELQAFNTQEIIPFADNVEMLNEAHEMELEIQKKSGNRFWAHVSTSPQFNTDGDFMGTVAIIRDITDQKLVDAWSHITANIARKISAEETSVQKIFEHTHRELGNVMPNKNFFAALREDAKTVELIYLADERLEIKTPLIRKSQKGLTEYVINTGKPLHLRGSEVAEFERTNKLMVYGDMPKSLIVSPLYTDNIVIGVIGCTSYDDENAYTDYHFNILNYVGKHIGIFIDKVEAEEDRNRILNLSQDLICIVNPAGYLRYVNPAFEKQLGYTRDELHESQIEEILHPDDTKLSKILASKVRSGERNFNFESRLITKDGKTLYISWTAISQEKADLFYCIGRDITEQREIQKRIEESELRYRGLFERLNEGILHSDINGIITTVNPGFCKILGYKAEELVGKYGYDLLHDEKTANRLKQKIKYREKGIPGLYETEFRKKSGELVWAQVSATPHYDANGVFLGVMSIITDISERKKAEMEAVAMKEVFTRELENKVKERTEELENARKELAVSLEKEKELSRLKSRFVSTASHQFRTPLSVIQSNIGILSMQMDSITENIDPKEFRPKFDKVYQRIKDQIERMTDLMNDVLILGKINAGNISMRLNEYDLIEVCQSVLNSYSEINVNYNMELKVEGKPRAIKLDKQLFEHALSNIVSNALKYSPDGTPPDVKIVYNGKKTSITIKDHGIGIPEEELVHLFDPFYRASNAKDYSGTGLGTSIAKEYVELIGGTIHVSSQLGKGTEFEIQLNN